MELNTFDNEVNNNSDTDRFRVIEEIPPKYREIFKSYPCFNAVQSKVLDDVFYSDDSVVVSAPTGSGKTVIFELAIARVLSKFTDDENSIRQMKIVYISPIKALCQERLIDWHKKFSKFGLNPISATGDSDNVDLNSLLNHNLIITTPEKWDSLTRKWRDNKKLVQMVKLFMIDEVHLLNEEGRGATLEVIVTRMKTIENSFKTEDIQQKIRFIALSATICNVDDISAFICDQVNTKFYKFSENFRPVELERLVLGFPGVSTASAYFKFDLSLNFQLPRLIARYSNGKPTLIFCSTRKSVEMAAEHIVKNITLNISDKLKCKLQEIGQQISDVKIKQFLSCGVAYHHAGLLMDTRVIIENLFRNGELPILVTTSTLAMGVNLPAHLVIIKSTKCYNNGTVEDYSESAIFQMIGRAGRPQFDKSAVAIIMTTLNDKAKFQNMVQGTEPIESNLHKHLTEHLNAEIALRTITDLDVALQWLTSTFLYIRARKNPKHYGLPLNLSDKQVDKKLLDMCQIHINKLVKTGMATIDQDIVICPTNTGLAMAKYCLDFETMKLFMQISGTEVLQQMLGLISKCNEFSEMYLRVNDKKCLNMLNKSKVESIRYPLTGRIKTVDMKINCIIQAIFGCLDIYDNSIIADTNKIMRNGERITRCLVEYLQLNPERCFQALVSAIVLAKCFHTKLWENSPYVSKQLNKIGNVLSAHLVRNGITTFQKIIDSEPRRLETILNKKPPMGDQIIYEAKHLPKYELEMEYFRDEKRIVLKIVLVNAEEVKQFSPVNRSSVMNLLVGDTFNNVLLHERYAHSYMVENNIVIKSIPIVETKDLESITTYFISEDWVGLDCYNKLDIIESNVKNTANYVQRNIDKYFQATKKDYCKPIQYKKLTKHGKVQDAAQLIRSKTMELGNKIIKKNSSNNKIVIHDNIMLKPPNSIEKQVQNQSDDDKNDVELIEQLDQERNYNEKDCIKNVLISDLNQDNPVLIAACQKYVSQSLSKYDNEEINLENNQSGNDLNEGELLTQNNENINNEFQSPVMAGESQKYVSQTLRTMNSDFQMKPDLENDQNRNVVVKDLSRDAPQMLYINQPIVKIPPNVKGNQTKNMLIEDLHLNDRITNTIPLKYTPTVHVSQPFRKKNSEEFPVLKIPTTKIHPALEFEDQMHQEESSQQINLDQYRFTPQKKLSHTAMERQNFAPDSTVLSERSSYSFRNVDNNSERNKRLQNENLTQKNIKWRSPLVFYSPQNKFSPKFDLNQESIFTIPNENETFTTETLNTSNSSAANLSVASTKTPKMSRNCNGMSLKLRTRLPATKFALRDDDYNSSTSKQETQQTSRSTKVDEEKFDDVLEKISDICSNSFLESFGLKQKENATDSAVKYYNQMISRPVKDSNNISKSPNKNYSQAETFNSKHLKSNTQQDFSRNNIEILSQNCSTTPRNVENRYSNEIRGCHSQSFNSNSHYDLINENIPSTSCSNNRIHYRPRQNDINPRFTPKLMQRCATPYRPYYNENLLPHNPPVVIPSTSRSFGCCHGCNPGPSQSISLFENSQNFPNRYKRPSEDYYVDDNVYYVQPKKFGISFDYNSCVYPVGTPFCAPNRYYEPDIRMPCSSSSAYLNRDVDFNDDFDGKRYMMDKYLYSMNSETDDESEC